MPSVASGAPPQSEIDITVELVAGLLREQHADLADRPLSVVAEGWDNVTLRLGDGLAVRVPRREASAKLIENEIAWLPTLAPLLPLSVPAPVRTGRPTDDYPWQWSIVPWIEGQEALVDPLLFSEAAGLGSFLRSLHSIAVPSNAPVNPFRGVPFANRFEATKERLDQFAALADSTARFGALSETVEAGAAAGLDVDPRWLHGDLHAKNVISDGGRIVAVVDWGDMCAGDIATDLASVWMLFDVEHHANFWSAYGRVSEATMLRSRAWAVSFGLMIWANHHEADPLFAVNGLEAIRRATTA